VNVVGDGGVVVVLADRRPDGMLRCQVKIARQLACANFKAKV